VSWVTALGEHPRRAGRCRVALDGGETHTHTLSLEQVVALGLTQGMEVGVTLGERIEAAARATACYDKALDALARRARSRADLARWLRQREYTAAEIDPALERLETLGLLDDLAFARGFARTRLGAGRGFGPRRVAAELARRGVSRSLVDQVLAEQREEGGGDETAALDAIVARRVRAMRGLEPDVVRRRLYGYLARRGFDAGAISGALRRYDGDKG
jgi:regulatory protein